MSSNDGDYPRDWTPLHIAVWRHDFAEVYSLASPTSVRQEDDQGWTPVHLACAAESSNAFNSDQVYKRRTRLGIYDTRPDRKPPRGISYLDDEDNERVNAIGILNMLLKHNPILGARRHGSRASEVLTPLHCAASSGWLSHVHTLVEAGAPVYTGPSCSPLCWAKGGSGGNEPVAVYLREQLGEDGLAMIRADHERESGAHSRGSASGNVYQSRRPLLRLSEPSQRPESQGVVRSGSLWLGYPPLPTRDYSSVSYATNPASNLYESRTSRRQVNAQGLCSTCAGISFKDLCRNHGYFHLSSIALLRQSAAYCKFCNIIYKALGELDQLEQHGQDQIIIRLSNGNKGHVGMCTDPPILRAMEFRLVAKCTCPGAGSYGRSARDFAKCLGACEGIKGIEIMANIFSEREVALTIPTQFGLNEKSANEVLWSIQKGSEINSDPLSFEALSIIRKWIENCASRHKQCRRRHPSGPRMPTGDLDARLPTRVIDVNDMNGLSICIRESIEEHAKYVALSHRWVSGPTPRWVTTQAVLDSRKKWFSMKVLPKSIVDAVRVTRALGIQYLWIDSLCIIQDSPGDWEIESSRMASIYANAHITLFADCGRNDDHGFLLPRNSFPSRAVTLPKGDGTFVALNIRLSSWSSFKAIQFSLYPRNVETSYLSDRGWIFQERILSHRILHFGEDQMFWECNEGTFAEDGHVVLKVGQRECGQQAGPFSKITYAPVLDGTSSISPDSLMAQWERLVKAYSTLKFTRAEDKLPALSGLAAAFHARLKDNTYVAGIWRKYLPEQLAWSITTIKPEKEHQVWIGHQYSDGSCGGNREADNSFVHPSQLYSRPSAYRAPSFTWAAVEGEIEFHELSKPCAEVKSVSLDLPAKMPYGKPKHGSLTITGPFRRAWSCGPLKKDLGGVFCPRKAGYIPLYDVGWAFGYLLPDSKDDVDERDVCCLKLGEARHSTEIFLVFVCSRREKETVPKYRRIGLGIVRDKEVGFFAEAEVKTIEFL